MDKIILASSSIYRQELLKRLTVNFSTISPNINEARKNGENFEDLARRLSNEKAEAVSIKNPSAFVIGSDQTAEFKNKEVRKIFDADYCIWMDTIKKSNYENTDKIFEKPENFNLKISKWNQYSPKEIASLLRDV